MPQPIPGLAPDARLRAELVAALEGGHAHVPTLDALEGIPPDRVNERAGHPHSIWEIVEHLRVVQRDILDFVREPGYTSPPWPEAYWPGHDATPAEFGAAQQAFLRDLDAVVALVQDRKRDLLADLPHAAGYTLLRQALLVADHNAYHLGALVALRRTLGLWD